MQVDKEGEVYITYPNKKSKYRDVPCMHSLSLLFLFVYFLALSSLLYNYYFSIIFFVLIDIHIYNMFYYV